MSKWGHRGLINNVLNLYSHRNKASHAITGECGSYLGRIGPSRKKDLFKLFIVFYSFDFSGNKTLWEIINYNRWIAPHSTNLFFTDFLHLWTGISETRKPKNILNFLFRKKKKHENISTKLNFKRLCLLELSRVLNPPILTSLPCSQNNLNLQCCYAEFYLFYLFLINYPDHVQSFCF